MFTKIALAGATAAVIVGAGTAAIAATGDSSSSTTGTPASSTSSAPAASGAAAGRFAKRHPRIAALLRHHAVHGSIVTDTNGTYVTHDGVVGSVSAVSATSITVKASDGFTQTYAVTASTKVRERKDPKATPLTISSVHVGDMVGVLGTGAVTAPTATLVVEGMS